MDNQDISSLSPRDLFPQGIPPRTILGLDFDGTLVEIAPTPEAVTLCPQVKASLERIAARVCPLVICSGRMISSLEKYLGDVPGISFIGGHGLEWKRQGVYLDFTPPEWGSFRERFLPALERKLREEGGTLEDKGSSFTIHYRLSGTEFWQGGAGERWLLQALDHQARLMPGKMVWNVLPDGVNKGVSLQAFARQYEIQSVIYLGDEPTDETVFELPDLCRWSIRVGEGHTAARFRLPGVQAVHAWLDQLSRFESGLI